MQPKTWPKSHTEFDHHFAYFLTKYVMCNLYLLLMFVKASSLYKLRFDCENSYEDISSVDLWWSYLCMMCGVNTPHFQYN